MIELGRAPKHSAPLKPLLNQLLADTFDHAGTARDQLLFKVLIAHVTMMAVKIDFNLQQGGQRFAGASIGVNESDQLALRVVLTVSLAPSIWL
jgi:hypothetical protein